MIEKYKVGEYIAEFMEIEGVNDTDLSRLSGVSRNHIIQIKRGVAPLSTKVSLAISEHIGVTSHLLINLQTQYDNFFSRIEFFKNNKIKNLTEDFNNFIENTHINYEMYISFTKDPKKYISSSKIAHYQPSKAMDAKNFILIRALDSFEKTNNDFNVDNLKRYVVHEYIKDLYEVRNTKDAKAFFKNAKIKLREIGVNLKIMETGLMTTIKGISKQRGNNLNIFIEDSDDFADNVWYLTHELCHQLDTEATEDQVNIMTANILLGELTHHISDLTLSDIDGISKHFGVNKSIAANYWSFTHKKHIIRHSSSFKNEFSIKMKGGN